MTLPTFDDSLHDIGIDGVGWMFSANEAEVTSIPRTDVVPGQSRAALGEGRTDSFEYASFTYQTDWEAGMGQGRMLSQDRGLTALGVSMFQGHFGPRHKKLTATGGATGGIFTLNGTPYGFIGTGCENILTGATEFGSTREPDVEAGAQQVVTTAAGAKVWVGDDASLYRWDGAGAAEEITDNLPTGVTPMVVSPYGRFLWLAGQRQRAATPSMTAHGTTIQTTGDTITAYWSEPTTPGNTLLAVLWTQMDTGLEVFPESGVTTIQDIEDWFYVGRENDADNVGQLFLFAIERSDSRDGAERFSLSDEITGHVMLALFEVTGLAQQNTIDDFDSATTNTSTGAATNVVVSLPTVATPPNSKGLAITFAIFKDNAVNINSVTPSSSFTEAVDTMNATSAWRFHAQSRSITTGQAITVTVVRSTTTSSSIDTVAITLLLAGTPITAAITQTVFLWSPDDGYTWIELLQGDSTGIPEPISMLAAMETLWITTTEGLYSLRYEEREFDDHQIKVLAAIFGPHHSFNYPKDANSVGTWLASFDGSLYYNVGATLWRYPPGGNAEQIWPTHSWSSVGGRVQCVIAGENGVYFSAGGVLYLYNGFGFHQLNKEQVAGEFNALHWNSGRLYFLGDPAPYFDFGYASLRPDIYSTDAAKFDPGYIVSSAWDFEKVAELKVVRRFETHAEFNGGVTDGEAGSLTLQYLIGDDGVHPERYLADSSTPGWVTVGTHSLSDGNYKEFRLGTPIVFKKLYIRVIVTPGTVSWPYCEGYGIDGETLLPRRVRIAAPLAISTDVRDKAGGVMYDTDADVRDAIARLEDLRDGTTPYFTVNYLTRRGQNVAYIMVAEQLSDWLTVTPGGGDNVSGPGYLHAMAQFVAREIP